MSLFAVMRKSGVSMFVIGQQVEFRSYNEEQKEFSRFDERGNKTVQPYIKRIMRCERGDDQINCVVPDGIEMPTGLKKGDLINIEITSFNVEKDVVRCRVSSIKKIKA